MQFDRRELGVELVKDVDVMPIDPTENLPSIFAPMMVISSLLFLPPTLMPLSPAILANTVSPAPLAQKSGLVT